MPHTPRIIFHIGDEYSSESLEDPQWDLPVPLHRNMEGINLSVSFQDAVTYKDLFNAARAFLSSNNYAPLRHAVRDQADENIAASDISAIDISLLKHGQYYHPAWVKVRAKGADYEFVLNTAISQEGRKIIGDEFKHIDYLNNAHPIRFLPRVYDYGLGAYGTSNGLPMFLGEWLSGYHEFHLTWGQASDDLKVVVWGENNNHFVLGEPEVLDMIRRASMILTTYYHPITFQQIHPWHHAAGDFVIRTRTGRQDLKLITVRDYAPMMSNKVVAESKDFNPRMFLDGYLLFFLSLSLKMRMDRIDGVNEMTLYPFTVLPSIWLGFLQGLDLACRIHELPESVHKQIVNHIQSYAPGELSELIVACVARYRDDSPEKQILLPVMEEHTTCIYRTIQEVGMEDIRIH